MSVEASPQRFIQIDEDGYFKIEDLRMADAEAGRAWLKSLRMDDVGRAWTTMDGQHVLVEAFDEPFIALDVVKGPVWEITMPYGHRDLFQPSTLTLDEWDRFHGRTEKGIPFVFSRSAQIRFFDALDEFTDDSITIDGEELKVQPWLQENPDANQKSWWNGLYQNGESRWDLDGPSPALPKYLPKLKLPRSRILVLGCGRGHDAAHFASQGHIVTAIDFSEEAIARAKEKYAHLYPQNLNFIQQDVFKLPPSMDASFDVVFEHTLYCAINPARRNDLTKVWRRVLVDGGHLMGVFFTFDKPFGPPFGTSEWEIRKRIGNAFRTLFWVRLEDQASSVEKRLGAELFVYSQKRASL